jgi:molybdopterin converting factor small subunit
MNIRVTFYSYFKELAGVSLTTVAMANGATLGELFERLLKDYPKLEPMRKSTLLAVGVDYQPRDYSLKDGEEVALFPPVQGG